MRSEPAVEHEVDPAKTADEDGCSVTALDPSRRYATVTFMRGAIVALSIALLSGLLAALYYIPVVAPTLRRLGVNFTTLRPVHTTFVAAFIFLGGVAVVHRYFEDIAGPMGRGERLRVRLQVILWAIAGAGILSTLVAGVFSGREYMGFHPIFSIPLLLGWLLFTWNFLLHVGKGVWQRPVHVTMWAVGAFLFIYTFIEQHAWLIPQVYADPLVDLRVQWKATGTLVGSFNLFVYGSLYYLACKVSGSDRYAHSNLAYALFAIGLLNSFTNFGHHTYHLPQNDAVKWISFVISMLEIILFFRVVWDITGMVRARQAATNATGLFVNACKWWTAYILGSSVLLSIPPLNALVHGTPVIMGHGMGAEIGIDGMALFAAICWMTCECLRQRGASTAIFDSRRIRKLIIGLNVGAGCLVGWLTIAGVFIGLWRYDDLAPPTWVTVSYPYVLAAVGVVTAWFLSQLLFLWLRCLFPRRTRAPVMTPYGADAPASPGERSSATAKIRR